MAAAALTIHRRGYFKNSLSVNNTLKVSSVNLISIGAQSRDQGGKGVATYPECETETLYIPYKRTSSVSSHELASHSVAQRCDGFSSLGDRLFVTTSFDTNTTWMEEYLAIPYIVYSAGNNSRLHRHPNRGKEALGYLTFIAEYYECLPKVTLFAHPHRMSTWHSTHSLDFNIGKVRWDAIPGYAVLHRSGMWWDQYVRDPKLNLVGQELPYVEDKRVKGDCSGLINGTAYIGRAPYQLYRGDWISRAWDTFFEPAGMGPIMERTRCPVAAEFFVTRERIRAHPRAFYLKAIEWVIDAEQKAGLSRYEVACVFEHLWHVIFGEPAFMEKLTIEECNLYMCDA